MSGIKHFPGPLFFGKWTFRKHLVLKASLTLQIQCIAALVTVSVPAIFKGGTIADGCEKVRRPQPKQNTASITLEMLFIDVGSEKNDRTLRFSEFFFNVFIIMFPVSKGVPLIFWVILVCGYSQNQRKSIHTAGKQRKTKEMKRIQRKLVKSIEF